MLNPYIEGWNSIKKEFLIKYLYLYNSNFGTGFWVQNHLLKLCSGVVNSQRLFCNQTFCEMFVLKLFQEFSNPKCLLINYLSQIFYWLPEIFKTNVWNRFLSTKSPGVFMCCEFTKVFLQSKSWCEIFVLKISGIQNI